MNQQQNFKNIYKKRPLSIIGYGLFLVFLILAFVYYQERTFFVDIAYHLFYILKDNGFAIQNNRFGALFTQSFPLLGSRFNWELSTIAQAYSLSFVLLPLITFSIILWGIKNTKIAYAYLCSLTIMSVHTFFWIQSELPQALAFLFLFIALFDHQIIRNKTEIKHYFLPVSLLIIASFTHPLILFPFTFLMAFYLLTYPDKKQLIIQYSVIFIATVLIRNTVFMTPYDKKAIGGLSNIKKLFPNYLDIPSNHNFIGYLFNDYYLLVLAFMTVVIYYLVKRVYLKAFLIIGYFLGIIAMINISYPKGAAQFYLENQYLLLGFFITFPLVFDIIPRIKFKYSASVIIILICLNCLIKIINAKEIYTDRLVWMENIINETKDLPNKKLIIPLHQAPKDMLLMTWGTSYEIWLLSTIKYHETRSIIIEEKPNDFSWFSNSNQEFLTRWSAYPYQSMNPKYFKFNDSTTYVRY